MISRGVGARFCAASRWKPCSTAPPTSTGRAVGAPSTPSRYEGLELLGWVLQFSYRPSTIVVVCAGDQSDSAPSNLVAPSGARLRRVCFACEKPETPEDRLLQCITCQRFGHAACWELEPAIFAKALTYAWQCVDDKVTLREDLPDCVVAHADLRPALGWVLLPLVRCAWSAATRATKSC